MTRGGSPAPRSARCIDPRHAAERAHCCARPSRCLRNDYSVLAVRSSVIRSTIAVVVAGYASALAKTRVDSTFRIVEPRVYLVLVFHENIGAYGFARFQIAAAGPIGGVVDVARPLVVRRLRIRTQRPRQNRRRTLTDHLAGRDAL